MLENLERFIVRQQRFEARLWANRWSRWTLVLLAVVCTMVLVKSDWFQASSNQQVYRAYIGPGAGIALVSTFFSLLIAMFSALLALLTWPVRWAWRAWRSRKALRRAKVRRVVVLGLDGLDPDLLERFLDEGLLPNLQKLQQEGTYTRLGTTWPPLSPVAWSSFSTGSNPGKHNIFDFIARNKADYGPRMSSVRIGSARRMLRLGPWQLPLSQPRVEGLRRSKPFWSVLGEAGIFSAILRVPITFPPERFHGVQLSAMCVPDLRGTQGMFACFSEEESQDLTVEGDVGGERILVERQGDQLSGSLPGPENPLRRDAATVQLPLRITRRQDRIWLHVDGQQVPLVPNQYTDWVKLSFPLAPGIRARGVCRFYLKRFEAPFEMYCTPIHIDPDKPVMPISYPSVYSVYLAKKMGPYATLGLAEDTWSLSDGVLSEEAFLEQAYNIDDERKEMFFDALDSVRRGVVACVFDAPDRIQHMFWRFQEDHHPARGDDEQTIADHRDTIRRMYVRMDELVGRTVQAIDDQSALFVMSDHGFKSFRRGVDLNAWLRDNGYLKLKKDRASSDKTYLADVDWSRTQAFALGLAGIVINQEGREAQGTVPPGEPSRRLAKQLCEQLTGLVDPQTDEVAIHEAVDSHDVYQGPYVREAPDVIIGYSVGYRVSWDAAIGKCGQHVFADNTKAWSGDHCIHPDLVPGILFSNWPLKSEESNIIDLAPTVLDLLGVDAPGYMDGHSLLCNDETS